ncbi:MAG: hypothetical protein AAB629_00430 [Patescibacteria group bacterium]
MSIKHNKTLLKSFVGTVVVILGVMSVASANMNDSIMTTSTKPYMTPQAQTTPLTQFQTTEFTETATTTITTPFKLTNESGNDAGTEINTTETNSNISLAGMLYAGPAQSRSIVFPRANYVGQHVYHQLFETVNDFTALGGTIAIDTVNVLAGISSIAFTGTIGTSRYIDIAGLDLDLEGTQGMLRVYIPAGNGTTAYSTISKIWIRLINNNGTSYLYNLWSPANTAEAGWYELPFLPDADYRSIPAQYIPKITNITEIRIGYDVSSASNVPVVNFDELLFFESRNKKPLLLLYADGTYRRQNDLANYYRSLNLASTTVSGKPTFVFATSPGHTDSSIGMTFMTLGQLQEQIKAGNQNAIYADIGYPTQWVGYSTTQKTNNVATIQDWWQSNGFPTPKSLSISGVNGVLSSDNLAFWGRYINLVLGGNSYAGERWVNTLYNPSYNRITQFTDVNGMMQSTAEFDPTSGIVKISGSGDAYWSVMYPVKFTSTGTLPTSVPQITSSTIYWFRNIDQMWGRIYPTATDAMNKTNQITFSNIGTGSHYIVTKKQNNDEDFGIKVVSWLKAKGVWVQAMHINSDDELVVGKFEADVFANMANAGEIQFANTDEYISGAGVIEDTTSCGTGLDCTETSNGIMIAGDSAQADGLTKGLATFNSTNFSDNGSGVINTVQNIDQSSNLVLGGLSLRAISPPSSAPKATTMSNIAQNHSFELASSANWGQTFASWYNQAGNGTITDETSFVHFGSHAAKLTTNTGASDIYFKTVIEPGTTYYWSFYTRGDGTYQGRYKIYDQTNGADIVSTTNTGVTETSYTRVSGSFVASVGSRVIYFIFYSPSGTSGPRVAYFDDVYIGTHPSGNIADGTYYYTVTALNGSNESATSTESPAITLSNIGGNGMILLSWATTTGATSYKVYRTTTSQSYGATSYLGNPSTTYYEDSSVSPTAGMPPLTPTDFISLSGTATSTFGNGINLSAGCFAINNVCISGGSGSNLVVNLGVTGISAVQTFASADNTFENGWKWVFDVTVPTNKTALKMKFADWTKGSDVIPAEGNIRIYSAQSSNAYDSLHAITINTAGTYSDEMDLNPNIDLDAISKSGRQIQIIVEARVPESSAGGSYSTSYGIKSIPDTIVPVITWVDPAPISGGTALSSTQLNAIASVDGTFSYTPAKGTILPVGSNELSVGFTPADSINYSSVSKKVTIDVILNIYGW